MARQRKSPRQPDRPAGRVDSGLSRAVALLERLAARINASLRPLADLTATVASAYGQIASASSRIAAALRSAVKSMKELGQANQASAPAAVGANRGLGNAAATGAIEGASSVAASGLGGALPKLWSMIAGSSAATASSAAATTAAMTASTAPAAATASAAAGAAGSLAAAGSAVVAMLPPLAAVAAAGLAIYAVWSEIKTVWPTVVQDLVAAAKALSSIVNWTIALLNPMTYVRAAVGAVGSALGLVRDAIVGTAKAAKALLVGAADAAAAAWRRLASVVQSIASRTAAVVRTVGRAAATIGSSIASGFAMARDAVSATLERLTYAGVAIAAAGAAIAGPLTVAAQRFGEAGAYAQELAERSGASAQAMSELAYAADRTGVSIGDVADAIAAVGSEDRFLELGQQIASIADPAERSARAVEAFGQGGARLLALFDRGPGALADLRKEAVALGLTFDGPAASSAAALTRSYQILRDGLRGLWQTIGQAVAPAITDWNELLSGAVKGAIAWAKANQPLIAGVFRVAEAAAMAGTALATITGAIIPALPAITATAAAAAAGAFTWSRYGKSISDAVGPALGILSDLYDEAARVFGGIGDAVRAGNLELAVEVAWLGVQAAWTRGLASLSSITGETLGGITDALAAADWQSAAQQAWLQIQVVLQQGVAELADIWLSLRDTFDEVITYLRQAWNTALRAVGAQLDSVLAGALKIVDTLNKFDPTDATKEAGAMLRRAQNRTSWMPADGANDALQAELEARKQARNADAAAAQQNRDDRIEDLRREASELTGAAKTDGNARSVELQARLDDAIRRAEEARRAAAARTPDEIRRGDQIEQARRGVGVSSGTTFSAAALMAMAGSRPNRQEQLQAQALAKLDKQIEQNEQLIRAVQLEVIA